MLAVEISKFGKPDVLSVVERPIPIPKSEEVLIKVIAAGVNRADLLQRMGYYPPPDGISDVPGLEVSGEIVSFGSDLIKNLDFEIGSKVCALLPGGGYAQYCVVPIWHCLPVPKNVNDIEAAALPEACFTVWSNLYNCAGLRKSESLLIHGGASGIGTTAVQLASAIGSVVYATAGSDQRSSIVESLGAKKCINYNDKDFVNEILNLTDGKGIDVILDIVGGDYTNRNLKILKRHGRLVLIAFLKGPISQINCKNVVENCLQITGSNLRSRSVVFKSELASNVYSRIWPLLEKKIVKPIIYKVFPMHQANLAHSMMENGENIGKMILEIA